MLRSLITRIQSLSRRSAILLTVVLIILIVYVFSLPQKLFTDPHSTVLEDYRGELLTASIAADGQWRFPEIDTVPARFAQALVAYEDKRFWYHPGVDPLSLARAFRQNFREGKIVSGGSTLTMQVIRLSRKGQARTITEKVIEAILATRLELRYSKQEILALYASHAPFGGNVVGLEAACWRYFGRKPDNLSWAEAATLAVLPNAPSLIHPGKNRDQLRYKRDALLTKLKDMGVLDSFSCELAKQEPIPEKPHPIPSYSRHLLTHAIREGRAQRLQTTVQLPLQQRVEEKVQQHHIRLRANQVNHACAIILDVETGAVLAYVGNVSDTTRRAGNDVDVITAPRSTGSILKPFLYAAMLDDGKMLPASLLPDVPTYINGFAPKNFSHQFDGAVHANEALIRSLNVPAVHMLQDYRYERFYTLLQNAGMTTLAQPADHYGLALILGGAEGTLWDITGMYASLARTLNHYFLHAGATKYSPDDFHAPTYHLSSLTDQKDNGAPVVEETSLFSAASIYNTFDALKEVYRPGEESGWRYFSNRRTIAWKTGTSFGHRDAWAVGVTPRYAVGVWVGNASGEGRPGLTGSDAAAPLLFDIFSLLQQDTWFREPASEWVTIEVCASSGYRATPACGEPVKQKVGKEGLRAPVCTYHQIIHVTADAKYRVNSACVPVNQIHHTPWFVLPPVQEYYFRSKNVSYRSQPPVRRDCATPSDGLPLMDMIYPKAGTRVFIPRNLDGTRGSVIAELAHRTPEAVVYWHLDDTYLGSTTRVHQMAIQASPGKHTMTLIDESGQVLKLAFEVISDL